MSKSKSRKRLSSGAGVAASQRTEQAPAGLVPASEPSPPALAVELAFDDVFELPVLAASRIELSLERLLEEYFPGAFLPETPEPAVLPAEPPIKTLSLVQLYLDQGFVAEARQMLEQILAADPKNRQAREKLQALRFAAAEEGSTQQVFKRWLGAIETVKRHRGMALLA